jgi:ribosomal protein L40E
MERIFYTIIGFIVLYVMYVVARAIFGVIFAVFFTLCALIRKAIGGSGTWISSLIFVAVTVLAIQSPRPFPTNQQFSQVYGTALAILLLGSLAISFCSLVGAYILRDSEFLEKLRAKGDVAGLIKFMRDRTRSEPTRNLAVAALVNMGETAIEPLVAALKEDDAGVAKALVGIGKPAVEPLIAALGDESYAAAWVLGGIGGRRAVEPLIGALKSDNEKVREAAAGALGLMDDTRAIEPLHAALKDESGSVRQAASKTLEKIDPRSKVAQLFTQASICPKCKTDNPPNSWYCQGCGQSLRPDQHGAVEDRVKEGCAV